MSTPLCPPDVRWCDDGLPVASQYNEPYYSAVNGLEESRHVFLQHNGIPERWSNWPWAQQATFCIIETGFGTGLNFMATWEQWLKREHSDQGWLHLTSIEKYPLTTEQLRQAHLSWPSLKSFSDQLLDCYPQLVAGMHHLSWPKQRISLTLCFGDVHDMLKQLSAPVHAWYLDGFSPGKNPDMWSDDVFAQVRRLSHLSMCLLPEGQTITASTFTVAGLARRGLRGAGFAVRREPGFGRKMEMLAANFHYQCGPEQPPYYHFRPWLLPANRSSAQQVVIIGAGLAGTTTARALAERGVKVTVYDPNGIAQKASGNPQGGLYIKVSTSDDAQHTEFYLSALQYSLQWMTRYLGAGDAQNPYWQQCGVLQLAYDEKEQLRQKKFLTSRNLPEALIRPVSLEEASTISGSPQASGGLFFPQAGWVSPADLCRTLMNHPNIELIEQAVERIEPGAQGWILHSNNQTIHATDLVVACAYDAQKLLPDAYLPIKNIRGQLSLLHEENTPPLHTVLCGRSYMAPPRKQQLCLGATYNLKDDEPNLRDEDHFTNLNHLVDFGEHWQQQAEKGLDAVRGGRVGFRCTTPDYLPMVGNLVYEQPFVERFHKLAKNARQIAPNPAPFKPHLWLNIGHGSRGLVSAPLCAEMLAAQLCNDVLPIGLDLQQALWPSRFLLRDLIRRKLPPLLQQEKEA